MLIMGDGVDSDSSALRAPSYRGTRLTRVGAFSYILQFLCLAIIS